MRRSASLKAIILAGGKGSRLHPITELIPKPLLPIGGRPILATLLSSLKAGGILDVAIVIGHLGHLIRRFVGSGGEYGLRINYYEQIEPKGSGHAVMKAIRFIDDVVMIVAGDTAFTSTHIAGLAGFHRQQEADVSLCLKRLPFDRLAATSSVQLADNHRIVSFEEKPEQGSAPTNLAAGLLHIYPPSLEDYLNRVPLSPRGEYELTAIIKMMIDDGLRVVGKEFPTPPDITDARDLLDLNFPYMKTLLTNVQARQSDCGTA